MFERSQRWEIAKILELLKYRVFPFHESSFYTFFCLMEQLFFLLFFIYLIDRVISHVAEYTIHTSK